MIFFNIASGIPQVIPLQSQKQDENDQSVDVHVRVLSVRVGGWEGIQCQKGTIYVYFPSIFSTDNTPVYTKFSGNTHLSLTKLSLR